VQKVITGILIICCCVSYVNAVAVEDKLGLWNHWTVLYRAWKINANSIIKIDDKLELNQLALQSAPSPWLIRQRIKLLQLQNKDVSWEKERLKIIFNQIH